MPLNLRITEQVDVLAPTAHREPMIVELPSGALFMAGYSKDLSEFNEPPNLFRSDDGGFSWAAVDVGGVEDGAIGNSDVDLAVDPEGRIYFLTMGFDRSVAEGTHISVAVSEDDGNSWRWRSISQTRFDDRPWIVLSPSGRAHIVWNDGDGVRHSTSDDAGNTWTERSRIHPAGGSSHFAVGANGELAVRISPESASANRYDAGVDFIAVSLDDGETWTVHDVPGQSKRNVEHPDFIDIPRWVEPIAWTSGGVLNYFWSEGKSLLLGRSEDYGANWNVTELLQTDADQYFPLLVSDGNDLLAASWYSGYGDDLRANVGLISTTVTPAFISMLDPVEVDAWQVSDTDRSRETAGEYFPVVFLSNGDLGMALTIQNGDERDDLGKNNGFSWFRIGR